MSFTVKEALEQLARYNGDNGTCDDEPSNLRMLNRARRLIYERGDYKGTMEMGCIPVVDGSCLYLPWNLAAVRSAWIGNATLGIENMVYQTVDRNADCMACCTARNRISLINTGEDRPIVKTPPKEFRLMFLATNDKDEEVELTFKSINLNGEHVRETIRHGLEPQGEFVRDVLSVVKPRTKGAIRLFGQQTNLALVFLASFHAEQVNPRFRQFRLSRTIGLNRTILAYAKKRFYDMVEPEDIVDIESMQALQFGYQAMNASDGNRRQEYIDIINLMEEQLEEFDQDFEVSLAFNIAKVSYAQAINPRYDDGLSI